MKALMIFSHPNLGDSIANKTIVEEVRKTVDNIEIRHLDALYPDFNIDVAAEQKALLESDIIIFQHPFYWYSVPPMLKKWMDDVLEYGFAFGHGGDKLQGKHFIQSLTVGGPEESYKALGYNHFTVGQFLRPIEQTVHLALMVYHGFIHTHRNAYIAGAYNSRREVEANGKAQAGRIAQFVADMRAGDIPHIEAFMAKWFAGFDDLDENSFFTQYLAQDIKMNMVGAEPITSIAGFNAWYDEAKKAFEVPTEHIISNVTITPVGEGGSANAGGRDYDITFDVVLNVVMAKDKSPATINAQERWLLHWDSVAMRPTIKEYAVWLV